VKKLREFYPRDAFPAKFSAFLYSISSAVMKMNVIIVIIIIDIFRVAQTVKTIARTTECRGSDASATNNQLFSR